MIGRQSVGYLKLPPELHRRISARAQQHHRKIMAEVLNLLERGLEAEEGVDAGSRLDAVEREIQTIKEQMPLYGRHVRGPRRRAAS